MITPLQVLFADWRQFEKAALLNDSVPDYRLPAMRDKLARLPAYQQRLSELSTGTCPIEQQID